MKGLVMEIDKQAKEKLHKLMIEHPNLPVIPMVDTHITDFDNPLDTAFVSGEFADVYIDKCLMLPDSSYCPCAETANEGCEENVLNYYYDDKSYCDGMTESQIRDEYNNLPWQYAIFINIITNPIW